jgi:hypothetical protein
MRFAITYCPEERVFALSCEEYGTTYLPEHLVPELACGGARLEAAVRQATKNPETPVTFSVGRPAECSENYQRSLVRAGSEDAASLHFEE